MPKIVIISSSIRKERKSHRVAIYFKNFLDEYKLASSEILDLQSYNFPLFEERLKYQESPAKSVLDFAAKVRSADGVIIVTPEYNGGYPASLKNVIDLLTEDWWRKPVAISTVSDGNFGGSQVITALQFSLWKIKALTVTAMYPVPKVHESFDADGVPVDKKTADRRAADFMQELFLCIESKKQITQE